LDDALLKKMAKEQPHSPLLGYNTNVRHSGELFHIQTEDSGVGHPHVITHLFVEGTILATKKTSYSHLLESEDLESGVRQLMKDQHKAMFIELRDGVHDEIASRIIGEPIGAEPREEEIEGEEVEAEEAPKPPSTPTKDRLPAIEIDAEGVRIIRPSVVKEVMRRTPPKTEPKPRSAGRSIFDTPAEDGDFGESMITDKSLDEVILSYLADDLDE
jgi:hypothetical protein